MKNETIAARINTAAFSKERCIDNGRPEMAEAWERVLERCFANLPQGSGFDCGTTFNLAESKEGTKLVFDTSYHYMTEAGYYDGWYDFKVVVRPTFSGFSLKVIGKDRDGIKEYIADVFYDVLAADASGDEFTFKLD